MIGEVGVVSGLNPRIWESGLHSTAGTPTRIRLN